jgi:hypothetical protein
MESGIIIQNGWFSKNDKKLKVHIERVSRIEFKNTNYRFSNGRDLIKRVKKSDDKRYTYYTIEH